jgi:Flp pilus assembly protein CpaB
MKLAILVTTVSTCVVAGAVTFSLRGRFTEQNDPPVEVAASRNIAPAAPQPQATPEAESPPAEVDDTAAYGPLPEGYQVAKLLVRWERVTSSIVVPWTGQRVDLWSRLPGAEDLGDVLWEEGWELLAQDVLALDEKVEAGQDASGRAIALGWLSVAAKSSDVPKLQRAQQTGLVHVSLRSFRVPDAESTPGEADTAAYASVPEGLQVAKLVITPERIVAGFFLPWTGQRVNLYGKRPGAQDRDDLPWDARWELLVEDVLALDERFESEKHESGRSTPEDRLYVAVQTSDIRKLEAAQRRGPLIVLTPAKKLAATADADDPAPDKKPAAPPPPAAAGNADDQDGAQRLQLPAAKADDPRRPPGPRIIDGTSSLPTVEIYRPEVLRIQPPAEKP